MIQPITVANDEVKTVNLTVSDSNGALNLTGARLILTVKSPDGTTALRLTSDVVTQIQILDQTVPANVGKATIFLDARSPVVAQNYNYDLWLLRTAPVRQDQIIGPSALTVTPTVTTNFA